MFLVESCLYGDKLGVVFSNGWTCADMVTNGPHNCPNNAITCCYSCAPYLTTTTALSSSTTLSSSVTTTGIQPVSTSSVPSQSPDADSQCASNRGAGSFMCRVWIKMKTSFYHRRISVQFQWCKNKINSCFYSYSWINSN